MGTWNAFTFHTTTPDLPRKLQLIITGFDPAQLTLLAF